MEISIDFDVAVSIDFYAWFLLILRISISSEKHRFLLILINKTKTLRKMLSA